MSHALYRQATGEFLIMEIDDGGQERVVYETHGYSGRAVGRNRPAMEDVRGVGPIPRGRYSVVLEAHSRFKPPAFRLVPHDGNIMHGRSGFWIHGDSLTRPGDASTGCIVLSHHAREYVAEFKPATLEVVPI